MIHELGGGLVYQLQTLQLKSFRVDMPQKQQYSVPLGKVCYTILMGHTANLRLVRNGALRKRTLTLLEGFWYLSF